MAKKENIQDTENTGEIKDKKALKEEKKRLKAEQKAQKKEAKRRAKELTLRKKNWMKSREAVPHLLCLLLLSLWLSGLPFWDY